MEVSLFSSEYLESNDPKMSEILDFRHFSVRLFYDWPNYFSNPDAPNHGAMTARKRFQKWKEMKDFLCGKIHRDANFDI